MLNTFWSWFAIIVTLASIFACWWLLHWTKGISDRDEDEGVDDIEDDRGEESQGEAQQREQCQRCVCFLWV